MSKGYKKIKPFMSDALVTDLDSSLASCQKGPTIKLWGKVGNYISSDIIPFLRKSVENIEGRWWD